MFFKNLFKINDQKYMDNLSRASSIGLHMVTGTFVGGIFGYYLDDWLGTRPWLTVALLLVGVVAGFKNVYLDTRRLIRDQEKEDAEKFGPKDR